MGYSAKYGTYTVLDTDTKKILDIQTVTVGIIRKLLDFSSSTQRERECFFSTTVVPTFAHVCLPIGSTAKLNCSSCMCRESLMFCLVLAN